MVHLFGSGGDEDVAVGPLLDLGFEGAGGIVGGDNGDALMGGFIVGDHLVQRLLHGGGSKNIELHRLRLGTVVPVGGGLIGLAFAAGGEGQDQTQGHQQGKQLLHGRYSFLILQDFTIRRKVHFVILV